MAGIIARITRSNRERLEKKKCEISASKCNYCIQPFDPSFDPKVHNKYISARLYHADSEESKSFHSFVADRIRQLENEERQQRSQFSLGTFCCEFIIIFFSLVSVPSVFIWLCIAWPQMDPNS